MSALCGVSESRERREGWGDSPVLVECALDYVEGVPDLAAQVGRLVREGVRVDRVLQRKVPVRTEERAGHRRRHPLAPGVVPRGVESSNRSLLTWSTLSVSVREREL